MDNARGNLPLKKQGPCLERKSSTSSFSSAAASSHVGSSLDDSLTGSFASCDSVHPYQHNYRSPPQQICAYPSAKAIQSNIEGRLQMLERGKGNPSNDCMNRQWSSSRSLDLYKIWDDDSETESEAKLVSSDESDENNSTSLLIASSFLMTSFASCDSLYPSSAKRNEAKTTMNTSKDPSTAAVTKLMEDRLSIIEEQKYENLSCSLWQNDSNTTRPQKGPTRARNDFNDSLHSFSSNEIRDNFSLQNKNETEYEKSTDSVILSSGCGGASFLHGSYTSCDSFRPTCDESQLANSSNEVKLRAEQRLNQLERPKRDSSSRTLRVNRSIPAKRRGSSTASFA